MEVALYGNNMGTRYVPKLIVSTMCVCVLSTRVSTELLCLWHLSIFRDGVSKSSSSKLVSSFFFLLLILFCLFGVVVYFFFLFSVSGVDIRYHPFLPPQ